MPRTSERKVLLSSLEGIVTQLALEGEDESAEFDEMMDIYASVESTRFLHNRVPTFKDKGFREMLHTMNDKSFRQAVRMTKPSFWRFVSWLEQDPIFSNRSRNPQAPVWAQAYTALSILGFEGNGHSVGELSRKMGIGEGTVTLYTSRVIDVLFRYRDVAICWPDAAERRQISARMEAKYHMKGFVMIVDGTYFPMNSAPNVDPEVYFTRKSNYCQNAQLFAIEGKVRNYFLGNPGSVYDNTILKGSSFARNPHLHF